MCGIAGFVGQGNEDILRKMVNSLKYRGPDKQEIYKKNNVGFAHARLSILDTSDAGTQPFLSNCGRYAVVFNGEIFNYLDLKSTYLQGKGISFVSTSDTEVLLHLLIHQGKSIIPELNGMFAFSFYDFEKEELLVARDRMGQKPFYYIHQKDTFVFASELKALRSHPIVDWTLSNEALNSYLTFDYVPNPQCIINGVKKLESGTLLTLKGGQLEQEYYYQLDFTENREITFDDAVAEFDDLLEKSVKARLISDVPLGVFLSGGLDSSAVAYYAQKNANRKIKTFSIGFENKSYDESEYAKKVAKHLNTDHQTRVFSVKNLESLIPEVSSRLDEPFADPSVYPTYMLSAFAREQVTVSLGGDGSDELLAGYPTFISDRFKGFLSAIPLSLKPMVLALLKVVPVSDKNISFDFKLNQFFKGMGFPKSNTHSLWLGSFTPDQKKDLLKPDVFVSRELEVIQYHLSKTKSLSDFNSVLYTYMKTYLDDDILAKVDRASMLNSLEVRAPFLDYRLVNFVNTLPKSFKLKGNQGKYLLKKTMEDKLPEEIIYRPKKGFGIPVSSWIKDDLKDLVGDYLSPDKLKKQGIFNPDIVEKLQSQHLTGKRNNRKEIWNLFVFQMWYDNFMK